MRQAPSMTGLRVFEAVVRLGSLSAAARELCVTPAAISHRLRDLEAASGQPLVRREAGRFRATEAGRAVLDTLGDAFDRIRAADALLQPDAERLRITASYSFAVLWLMPRISTFQARHPDTELFIHPSHNPMTEGAADVRIVHAARQPEAGAWSVLFADRCAVLAGAGHRFFTRKEAGLASVLEGRLVHITHDRGPDWGEFSWRVWAAALGLEMPGTGKAATVSAEHLAVELLLTDDAFALVSTVNASRLLETGRFRAVPGSEMPSGCSYWIADGAAQGRSGRLARDFRQWIAQELRADA